MRRMMKRFGAWASNGVGFRDEGGAVLVFVAVSLVMLMGFVAFTVDFGRIYSERRELQNGADAAALAVAFDCASTGCGASMATAESYADANASDGLASVDALDIDLNQQRVHVRAITEDPGGDNFFDMTFAKVLGYDGLTVRADATVIWGPLGRGASLPVIFSTCEWDKYFKDKQYTMDQVAAGLPAAAVSKIVTHGKWDAQGNPNVCSPSPSGFDLPGGFGFLDAVGCEAEVAVGEWIGVEPGAALKKCDLGNLLGSVVLVPYFESVDGIGLTGNGNNGRYLVEALGPMYLTGYRIPSAGSGWLDIPRDSKCQGSTFCIEGYFISDYVVGDGEIGGPDRGVSVVVFES